MRIAEDTSELDIDHAESGPVAASQTLDSEELVALRTDILKHFKALRLPHLNGGEASALTKQAIRGSHAFQRADNFRREVRTLASKWKQLLLNIANGSDVHPEHIDPELIAVRSDHWTGDLFRFAALLWSVPVSKGYGRRIRYLVRDRSNGKLIGIFALGDPVFNLRARDSWIGWTVEDRRARLVNVMDAYVVGAVPPYSQILGGKLVASLIGSAEVNEEFSRRYQESTGIISGKRKAARLVLVTITSALGRSSLYNRLRLIETSSNGSDPHSLVELVPIGYTQGYGHFQLSEELFERLRAMLAREGHPYANGHQFGQGPNWRLRVVRVGLKRLGLDEDLTRHGISREIYAMPLASNFRDFLCGRDSDVHIKLAPTTSIAEAALHRWVIPRAARQRNLVSFQREQLLDLISVPGIDFGASLKQEPQQFDLPI